MATRTVIFQLFDAIWWRRYVPDGQTISSGSTDRTTPARGVLKIPASFFSGILNTLILVAHYYQLTNPQSKLSN